MHNAIHTCTLVLDPDTNLKLAALCARQGWSLRVAPAGSGDLAADTPELLARTPQPDFVFADTAPVLAAALAHPACTDAVLIYVAEQQDTPLLTNDARVEIVSRSELTSDAFVQRLVTRVNLQRFRLQFFDEASAEPITKLPRHSELLQLVGQYGGQAMGVLVAQIDHGEHIYANLDPVSKTDLLGALSAHLAAPLPSSAVMGIYDATCFVVWIPEADPDVLWTLAEALCVNSRQAIEFRSGQLHFTLSCGYAHEATLGEPQRLWRTAWAAKEDAREAGGDTHRGTSSDDAVRARIPEALAQNEFALVLQPQFSMDDAQLVGVETLLRWQGLEVGELAPDRFIPVAERSGQMARVGDWVLERASCEAATWLEHLLAPITLGVNVSPQQFHKHAITRQIERLARDQWLDPAILELELSHESLLHVVDQHRAALFALRDMGVRVAIDNLGAGVLDTTKLLRCPADTLKIDRSLIAQIASDASARRLVTHICELGTRFQLRVVAVGVENEAQRDALIDCGCTVAQGYFYTAPVPLESFQRFLVERLNDGAKTASDAG